MHIIGNTALALVFLSSVPAYSKDQKVICTGESKNAWIKRSRESARENIFYKFAESHFGGLASCSGTMTGKYEGTEFGKISFAFKNLSRLTIENLPPETSVVKLENIQGFPNETEAVSLLKSAVTQTGLKVDWNKPPESRKSGETETKTYWDPDSGVNGRGFLVYKNGKLISIGYGMAL